MRETAGIWKDRKDLPDFEAARANWDRQQSWRTQSFSTQMFLLTFSAATLEKSELKIKDQFPL
jgi:hypothetical protein